MSESLKGLHRTCRCAEISSSDIGKEVTVSQLKSVVVKLMIRLQQVHLK